MLLINGVNVDVLSENNITPLCWAMLYNAEDVATLLIKSGADVKAKDKFGRTPLHAADDELRAVAELLIKNGAEVNAKKEDGTTPLHNVAWRGDKVITKLLIAHGAEVNAKDNTGRTALHLAAGYDSLDWLREEEARENEDAMATEVVKLLIANDADINMKDEDGKTPLAYAVKYKFRAVEKLLRNAGAE